MLSIEIDIFDPEYNSLIRECAHVLERLPETHVTVKRKAAKADEQRDAILTVSKSGMTTPYVVECKRHVAAVVEPTLRQIRAYADRHDARAMIMAPYVNDELHQRLIAENVDYVDAAGNALVRTALPPLLVSIRGQKPVRKALKVTRLFHGGSGLQLIALLLTVPESITWSYRDLAVAAGISFGSASQLMTELHRGGYLPAGTDQLSNTADLLEQWVRGYHLRLRPKLFQKTYRTTEGRGPQDLVPLLARVPDVWVGGELAAGLTTGMLRPARATLHVPSDLDSHELMRALRLLPDLNGNVDVLSRFGSGNMLLREGPQGVKFIAPLLVYAELLETPDDRLRKTAEAVYNSEIAPHVGLADTR